MIEMTGKGVPTVQMRVLENGGDVVELKITSEGACIGR
jgi:hypothetical protein